jgi:phenylpropionate dioxygenase-like ring-hydroxylating dioxygenase large terminal subunit
MNRWNPALYQSWFVVGESRRLKNRPLSVTLLDRPLVIARLQSGALLALDDCCPHRHAPLSKGRVTVDGLQCPYHGWTFGADGRCTDVPGLVPPACMPMARVGSVRVIEHDGLIWVNAHATGAADRSAPPAFLRRLPADTRRFMWTSIWNARAVDALENFLDPLHTHFVHPGLVRHDGDRRIVKATVTYSSDGLQVDYGGQSEQRGLLYRLLESPRELERSHFSYAAAGSAQLEYRYTNGSALYFTLHFTPVSESVTQVYGTLHVENRWGPYWAVRLIAWPLLRHVARQDQEIVEAQAINKARFVRDKGVSTELDLVRADLDEIWSSPSQTIKERTRTISMLL